MDLKDKRVLVTGGAGFLGKNVVELLKKEDVAEITSPRSKDYDLVKHEDVVRLLNDNRPNVVIHLAAVVGGIGANMQNPAKYFYDNLMMGVQLIHESYKQKVEKFVAIGTICAYPKYTPVPFKEENLWGGYPEETNAPYGLAKKMLLVQSQAYRKQYRFNSIYLLPVNLYGPGDNFDLQTSHVIPAMIRKFVEAKDDRKDSVTLWGDGSPSREFLYVEDAARAILMATKNYEKSEPVNLGAGHEITIRNLAEEIRNVVGFDGKIIWDTTKPNGQPRRCLDVSRAKQEFGFEAKVEFKDGLERTYEWFVKRHKI